MSYLIASPALREGLLYFGTYNSDVLAVDWRNQKVVWALPGPQTRVPVPLLGRHDGGPRRRGRLRQVDPLHRPDHRQRHLEAHDAGRRGQLTLDRGGPGVHRFERREPVRTLAGRRDRAVEVQDRPQRDGGGDRRGVLVIGAEGAGEFICFEAVSASTEK